MRDILIVVLVLAGSLAALRRPWVGILVWTWLSVMNPHRYAYGFAFDAPLAAMAAACTLFGLLFTKDKESPFQGAPVLMFTLFTVWATISWLAGLDPEEDYWQWNKVIKINLMVLVALALMRSKNPDHVAGVGGDRLARFVGQQGRHFHHRQWWQLPGMGAARFIHCR